MKNLSVIVPALKVDTRLVRLLSSIRSCSREIEIVIVCPEQKLGEFNDLPIANISYKIIQESHPGIYSAMNDGVKAASRDYVMFFGIDDILLTCPDLADGVSDYDVILFDVFWGQSGVYKNFRNKYSLLFRNWCHQGVVYKRNIFFDTGFYELIYKYQEDHHMNIKIATNSKIKIRKSRDIISWYSADGISSLESDEKFRKNFPRIVALNYGYFFGLILRIKRLLYG